MEKIKLEQPAVRWSEALPLGNGHMGAMVYSGIEKDTLALSENTFFSGSSSSHNNQKGAAQIFYKMRQEIESGNYENAHKLGEHFVGIRNNYGTNLPVGNINITTDVNEKEVKNYQRILTLDEGAIRSSYNVTETQINRNVWISNPAKILVYEITSSQPINNTIEYQNSNIYGSVRYEAQAVSFTSYAYETMHCDTLAGTMLCGHIGIVSNGEIQKKENHIDIIGATNTTFYLQMCSNFKREEIEEQELQNEVAKHVRDAMKLNIKELQRQHKEDIKALMSRCTLTIEGTDQKAVTMVPFMFQYGRYLLLSSSREDSKLPAHLQGIWNDNVACRIGWTCDMHLDINTQMNYWPACVTNLSEVTTPLFSWITQDLMNNGRQTAKESYGLPGWVTEIVSNAWGYAAPYWAVPIAPCPTGGVWILTHMWEYYLFKNDITFLREEAFEAIEESTRFFTEYLFEDTKGNLICGPSISPENSFVINKKSYQLSNGCTYEILMIRELFQIYVSTCQILAKEKSNELLYKVKVMLPQLLPYKITKKGTIAEWNHNHEEADLQHRHTSHLLGLFPFAQITPAKNPELAKAVEQTIEQKLTPEENWEDTGWARSMLMLYEARLKHGDKAYKHIECMLEYLVEENGFIIHPPTRGAGSFDNVYELDGNTGLTSCISEMLLQSHENYIDILPALPEKWPSGNVNGLCARGNIEVGIRWKNGELEEVRLLAKEEKKIQVRYKNDEMWVHLKKEILYLLNRQ